MASALPLHSSLPGLQDNFGIAGPEDFQQFFATEMSMLFRLAMNLTADTERAETCLIWTMRNCFERGPVSKKRLPLLVRRIVVVNAIRLVLGIEDETPEASGPDICLQASNNRSGTLTDSRVVLQLPDVERLAFVICVLERYSVLQCALLLRKTPKEVHDAIEHAASRIASLEERRDKNIYAVCWTDKSEFDVSCGAILD